MLTWGIYRYTGRDPRAVFWMHTCYVYNQGMTVTKSLTPRETEILGLLAEGLSNDEIAQRLVISPNTVKVHVRNIFEKMQVQSRTEATMEAVRRGWISVPGLASEPTPELPPPTWPPLVPPAQLWQGLTVLLALVVGLTLGLWPQKTWQTDTPLTAEFSTDRGITRTTPLPRRSVPRWTQRSPMPSARSLAAAALLNGRLYVVGGENSQQDLATLESYDPTIDVWQPLTPRPVAARGVAAAVLDHQLIVAGGCSENTALSRVDSYTPQDDSWNELAPLPAPRCGGVLLNWQGQLIYIGGWDGQSASDAVFIYDADARTWQPGPALPAPRAFAAGVALPAGVWLLGGHDGNQEQADMWFWDGQAATWQAQPSLPAARAGLTAAADGTSIYAFGGGMAEEAPLHERFDLATHTWSTIEYPRNGPWRHAVAAMIGPNLHIIGGWGGDYLDVHEAYQAAFFQFLPLGAQNAR